MKTLTDRSVNWLYEAEPSEGTAGRRIGHPRGRTFGGSSSINGHIYNRGQRMDFDTWAQRGNRGWGYADVLPYFRRSERRIGPGDDRYRGRDGEFVIEDLPWRDPRAKPMRWPLRSRTVSSPGFMVILHHARVLQAGR